MILLPVVYVARYWKHLVGGWRGVFVIGSVVALYLNVFVLVVQLFHRIPLLFASAPTQKEPPFVVTQFIVLVMFVWLGRAAHKGFPASTSA